MFRQLAALSVTASAFSLPAFAQAPQPPAPVVKEAMKKLGWMVGDWRGEGWRLEAAGRETFDVEETIYEELDGLLIIVKGRGWSEGPDGELIEGHKAFGVFSYDAFARTYHFDAFVKEGYQTRNRPEVSENGFVWSHPAGPGAEMRYRARLTEAGEWLETGERCQEETCVQTFEMRLKRTSSD